MSESTSVPVVRVVAATRVTGAPVEEVTGSLQPARFLQLGFEVSGRLEQVHVEKGMRVKKGRLLGQLNSELPDAQVAQAKASVAAAQAGAALATDRVARNARIEAQQGNISESELEAGSANAEQSEAQVLVAKAALAQAEATRRRHELLAPFSGTLLEVPDQVGGLVSPGAALFSLAQLDPLILKTSVAESSRAVLKPGMKLRVSSVSGDASTEEATIRVILPAADPTTRRIPVEIVVPDPQGRFAAYTLARAFLPRGEIGALFAIPATAVASDGGDHVFLLEAGQQVRRVDVQVVERVPRELHVRSSVPLDKVIDHPASGLVDGDRVTVR
jgi:RND family efflux transporter MFP subunit